MTLTRPRPVSRPMMLLRSPYGKLALLAAIVAAAVLAARWAGFSRFTEVEALAGAVREVRELPFAPLLFVAFYAAIAAFGLPALALTLAGGAIFGLGWGTLLNWLGATLGALGGYLLARSLGRDAVARLLGAHAARLDRLATAHGFGAILRLRLLPIVPFNALNFAAGVAGVPLRAYVLGTALGIVPGTFVYTYFADSLLAGAAGAREQALLRVAVAGALLVLLSFLPAAARRLGWVTAVALAVALAAAAPAGATEGRDHPTEPRMPGPHARGEANAQLRSRHAVSGARRPERGRGGADRVGGQRAAIGRVEDASRSRSTGAARWM